MNFGAVGIKRIRRDVLRTVGQTVSAAYQIGTESTPGRTMGVLHAAWLRLDPEQRLVVEEMDDQFQKFFQRLLWGEMPGPDMDPRPFMRWAREVTQNPGVFSMLDATPKSIVPMWEQTWTGLDVVAPTLTTVQKMFIEARAGDDTAFLVLMDELMGRGYSRIRAAYMIFALVTMERSLEWARINLRMNHFLIHPSEIPALAERIGLLAEYADAWADIKPEHDSRLTASGQMMKPYWAVGSAHLLFDGAFDAKGRPEKDAIAYHQHKMVLHCDIHTVGHALYEGRQTPSWNMSGVLGADGKPGPREPTEEGLLDLWHFVAAGDKWERGRPLMLSLYFRKDKHYGKYRDPNYHRGHEHVVTPKEWVENVGRKDWEMEMVPGPLVGPPPGEGWIWGAPGYHRSQQDRWVRLFDVADQWL